MPTLGGRQCKITQAQRIHPSENLFQE